MLLTHAQGVSSSFEDGAALEYFLADIPASDSVESAPTDVLLQRLQQFEKFRLPRVSATQILTDPVVPGPAAAENYKKQEAQIRKYYDGPLPPTGSMPHSPPICQFFFGYDVRREAEQFMKDNSVAAQVSAPVSTPLAKSPTTNSHPAVIDPSPTTAAPVAFDPQALAVYREAQNALTAAQTALAQVSQTLATAQSALELATRNMQLGGAANSQSQHQQHQQFHPNGQKPHKPISTPLSNSKSISTPPSNPKSTVVAQGQAAPSSQPRPPRRLKSFDSMKSRMAAVGQKMSRGASVREVTPDLPSEKNAKNAAPDNRKS